MVPKELRPKVENRREASADTTQPVPSSVQVDVSGLSHPGKVRARNEDHFIVTRIGRYIETAITSLPPGEVPERADEVGYALILADGMGGHAGGELASRMAIRGLVELVITMLPDTPQAGSWKSPSR